ncbi:MAG: CRISPR-associated helicase Cas3' [Anaerolineales bacterium]|nr:CRISPR-associated helicase Cas3' [Anaerolineales bacterium]
MTRSIHDDDLVEMYTRQGRGYSDQELADHFEVGRDAIFKRRRKLESRYPFKETERGKYRIDTNALVSNIPIKPAEALVLYAFLRRSGRSTPFPKKHVKEALSKLAPALYKPMTEKLGQAAAKTLEHPDDAAREAILDKILVAWTEKRAIRLKYQALERRGDPIWHTVSPYLIEPSPWSDSVYLVGYSTTNRSIVPFSLERIAKAVETSEPFQECDPQTEQQILNHAWGIWHSDQKPERVRLKFSGYRAVRRLRESVWHPEESVAGPDDYSTAIWQADIAEPQEMLPWIRGWGDAVIVLEPEELREEIKGQIWKSARNYELAIQATDLDSRLLRLWGKTTADPDRFHPALYHLFDVAHVAWQLLSARASSRWRRVLAEALNTEAETLAEWLPYLIALHDIGKLSVPFQILNTRQHARLMAEGFVFGKAGQNDGRKLHHSIVGRIVLKEMIADWPDNLAAAFIEMVSGHHGIFQADRQSHRRDLKWMDEAEEWSHLRQRAIRICQSYLLQQWPDPLPQPANQSTAMMALNGFCILCDWLGSDETYFRPEPHTPLLEYIPKSRQRAHNRVRDAGFFQLAHSAAPTRFAPLFGFAPRPLQAAIDAIPDSLLNRPTLTIIEAPTGEGKTEAALALARRIAALRHSDEMYLALPTTATSNAMFQRVQTYLQERLGLPPELVKLVHGQDFLVEDDLRVEPTRTIELDHEPEPPSLAWFSPKKKALLAPFGVGTIDQAELSALNVRHNALRIVGLAGKTIILDEVHAYDTYMTTIIKRMLTWLAALGSSVILLSATLPQARRQELAQAFTGQPLDTALDLEAYPNLLTIGARGYHHCQPQAFQPGKTITLHWVALAHNDAKAKAQWLLDQVTAGGGACWMTNTVKRAQQIYAHLLDMAPSDVALDLLHAQFPLREREKREKSIRDKYGKDGQRPTKGIVVGTQVLEQSLDLDFDVMMTDLAPIDLVLQRAGRLHRHEREAGARHAHTTPHLYVNTPLETADKKIYGEYILARTLAALETRAFFALPEDYRPLIEAVYDETPPDAGDPLYAAWHTLESQRIKLEDEAELRLMDAPDPDYPFYRSAKPQGFKEDEDSSGWLAAQTRWGQESLTVIPLIREGETARTPAGDMTAPLNQAAKRETQLNLLRHSLRLSHQTLVKYLKTQPETAPLFTESALLRACTPLWLESDALPVAVTLHPDLGLVIGALVEEENDD